MRRFVLAAALAALPGAAACPAPATGDPGPGGGDGPPTPLPYVADDDEDPREPALAVDDLGPAMIDALATIVGTDPTRIGAAYDALWAGADGACPDADVVDDGAGTITTRWQAYESCTAAGGVAFAGAAYVQRFSDVVRADGRTESGFLISSEGGSFSVAAPDGRHLTLSGYFDVRESTNAAGAVGTGRYLAGELQADATTAGDDPWLAGVMRGELGVYTYADPGGYQGAYLGGAVSLEGDVTAVALDEAAVEANGGCDEEPAGVVSIRDANGVWHDVIFDARPPEDAEDEEWDEALCDGCGSLFVSGREDGTACVDGDDLAVVMDWTGRPW